MLIIGAIRSSGTYSSRKGFSFVLMRTVNRRSADYKEAVKITVPVARGHYIPVEKQVFLCVIPFVSPLVPTNKEAVTYLTACYLSS